MLFNSYIFIFVFLPIALLGFHLIGSLGLQRTAVGYLVAMSLFFYGWWNPAYLLLIIVSIIVNFGFGASLTRHSRRIVLIVGIGFNLMLLGYYKYANFLLDNVNAVTPTGLSLDEIILPLAISFFTFQQITYLVDSYRGETREYNFLHYCLFVTFFPQLIAGPIVHHREMLPQFTSRAIYRLKTDHLAIGLTIFFLGLFKKVVIADNIAVYSTPVFDAAEAGAVLTLLEAWGGALAYSFQLYFDFSGYSDMAIGLARMFGITLPINFFSPYKATSIIDFWNRWHITLSRFLRDYVYFSLGGNRKGVQRRYLNLGITMLLGGLWHGAGWTFVAWGCLHGIYLMINHAWRGLISRYPPGEFQNLFAVHWLGRLLTFLCVVVGWVMFRAESFSGAVAIYSGMLGLNGFSVAIDSVFPHPGKGFRLILVLLIWVWFAPNTLEWLKNNKPALYLDRFTVSARSRVSWQASRIHALVIFAVALIAILAIQGESEFLYFRF